MSDQVTKAAFNIDLPSLKQITYLREQIDTEVAGNSKILEELNALEDSILRLKKTADSYNDHSKRVSKLLLELHETLNQPVVNQRQLPKTVNTAD
jgi:hypothetical protein